MTGSGASVDGSPDLRAPGRYGKPAKKKTKKKVSGQFPVIVRIFSGKFPSRPSVPGGEGGLRPSLPPLTFFFFFPSGFFFQVTKPENAIFSQTLRTNTMKYYDIPRKDVFGSFRCFF